ncbi:MAG: DUF4271 domain-containing protein [Sediminibacterium sp.]|nr:DUF4271 domain-containing protein [Sediminibacterium sp.]
MKRVSLICFMICFACTAFCQADSMNRPESTRKAPPTISRSAPLPLKKKMIDTAESKHPDGFIKNNRLLIVRKDVDSLRADSISKAALLMPAVERYDTSTYQKFATHPLLPLNKPAMFMIIDYHKQIIKDELFYLVAGVIFILAFFRAAFPKYFSNLFLLFFQSSLRQKQTRDQLLQDNLASLLANLLFIISAGLYISLLIQYKNWIDLSFWWLAAGCAAVLLLTYLLKYLFLLFAGWVFNTKEAAGLYIFVIFMVNKVLGVMLIPFILILAFAEKQVVEVAINLSVVLLAILLAYRYWVSYHTIRNKLKVNALHFFLYLCAVELLPLVLIYKGLINYFAGSF